jgi:hypothetical protein
MRPTTGRKILTQAQRNHLYRPGRDEESRNWRSSCRSLSRGAQSKKSKNDNSSVALVLLSITDRRTITWLVGERSEG